jgi:hypothetical protein
MDIVPLLSEYLLRVLPGLVLGAAVLLLRPRRIVRVGVYLFFFILLRDAMTPVGLWSLGTEGFFWLRIAPSPAFLILFGILSTAAMVAVYALDRDNRRYILWLGEAPAAVGLPVGLVAALIVVLPLFIIYRTTPIDARGGIVPSSLLLPLAVFAFFGNFAEEGLFRGYVLGYLAERRSRLVAGVGSGLAFAFCHVFLASTVTGTGIPLLAFTVWEGVIAGLVGAWFGVIPATLTHGGAIFLLASGLF